MTGTFDCIFDYLKASRSVNHFLDFLERVAGSRRKDFIAILVGGVLFLVGVWFLAHRSPVAAFAFYASIMLGAWGASGRYLAWFWARHPPQELNDELNDGGNV